MGVVILKNDGTPVQLGASFTKLSFDVNGFLIGFYYDEIYKYYQNREFRKADRNVIDLSGYFKEAEYIKYIQGTGATIDQMLKQHKFKFEKYLANVNDPVNVTVVDFGVPYEDYYNERVYNFTLESTVDNSGVRKYKKSILNNLKIVDYEIDIPLGTLGNLNKLDLSHEPTYFFYTNNIGKYINNWKISDTEKSSFKKLATLIAYKINYIVKDIFPKILDHQSFLDLQEVANRIEYGISDLSLFKQTIFILQLNWGYFYIPGANEDLVYRREVPAMFSSDPNYDEYWYYYRGLLNFYDKCYKIQDNLLEINESERLNYLLEILPISALAVVPIKVILSVLSNLMKHKDLSNEDQVFIVRIIISITPPNADIFLDFLLLTPNKQTTNFEILYYLLDDARLERISYVKFFVDEQPNRKYFAFAIYKLWKVSKYNFNYYPPGTSPENGTNPNCFFNNSKAFNPNNLLVFTSIDTFTNNNLPTHIEVKFKSSLEGINIKIDSVERDSKLYIVGPLIADPDILTPLGEFHLYHPLSLVGYQPNLDLAIPKTSTIPAFLFYFSEEYDRLADFDAAISLTIDLTVDVLSFYFLGGASALQDLGYIKYVTRIGKGLQGLLSPTETVFIWRGLEATSETFSLSASVLLDINEYLISKENNELKRKILEKNREVFFGLLLLSSASSIFTRVKAVSNATEALDLIKQWPAGESPLVLNDNLIRLLQTLKGDQALLLAFYTGELNNLKLGEGITNNIFSIFNNVFTDAQKMAFWKDFNTLDNTKDIGFWKKLNGANGNYMLNWLELSEQGLAEAKVIDFITNQNLVNTLLRFNRYEALKARMTFLDFKIKVRLLTVLVDIDDETLETLNAYSYSIDIFKGHTSDAQKLIGQHIKTWLKYFQIRDLLKNKQYSEVSGIFNKSIREPFTVNGLNFIYPVEDAISLDIIRITGDADDVALIANRFNIDAEIIDVAKKHFFTSENISLFEDTDQFIIGRFGKDDSDITEWDTMSRGVLGKIKEEDISLFKRVIAHEYVEAKLMERGMNFRSFVTINVFVVYDFGAHDIAPLVNNGRFLDLGRNTAPPALDLFNMNKQNLDSIVNWYIDFYKL